MANEGIQTEVSHERSYTTVPEFYKQMNGGHYKQTPDSFGRWKGEWWLVLPFAPRPWELAAQQERGRPVDVLPEGFEAIFGLRPEWAEFDTFRERKDAVLAWEQDKENFVQAGDPSWASRKELTLADNTFTGWDMGTPSYYEHKSYGWMAMFLGLEVEEFQMNAHATVYHTHLVVASYQVQLLQQGIRPQVIHPLLSAGTRSDISDRNLSGA